MNPIRFTSLTNSPLAGIIFRESPANSCAEIVPGFKASSTARQMDPSTPA
jgi:hypothetical protein